MNNKVAIEMLKNHKGYFSMLDPELQNFASTIDSENFEVAVIKNFNPFKKYDCFEWVSLVKNERMPLEKMIRLKENYQEPLPAKITKLEIFLDRGVFKFYHGGSTRYLSSANSMCGFIGFLVEHKGIVYIASTLGYRGRADGGIEIGIEPYDPNINYTPVKYKAVLLSI